MGILESYLNEYKSGLTEDEQRFISNRMFKYIIGSCFKKMNRRASDWRSACMIHNLTLFSKVSFRADIGDDVTANPDPRLSKFLAAPESYRR